MKKIFAIALALVMVLSLSSAFAAFCVTPDWSCPADVCYTGTGKVEVIPYVRGNACPGENSWTVSTCAAAVNNDWVFAAVKVTVDADANEDWWAKATLELDTKGVVNLYAGEVYLDNSIPGYADNGTGYNFAEGYIAGLIEDVEANEDKLVAGEYYIVPVYTVNGTTVTAQGWKAVPAKDFEADYDTLFTAQVNDAAKAKFCATLKSKDQSLADVKVGDYTVTYVKGSHINVTNGKQGDEKKSANFFLNSDNKIEYVGYTVGSTTENFNYDDGANFLTIDTTGKVTTKGYNCAPYSWLKTVMTNFKFDFRTTCYTEKAFKANFGWEAKVESCFSWSANASAVVDADCVVAIPKTGDASVLAWLF